MKDKIEELKREQAITAELRELLEQREREVKERSTELVRVR